GTTGYPEQQVSQIMERLGGDYYLKKNKEYLFPFLSPAETLSQQILTGGIDSSGCPFSGSTCSMFFILFFTTSCPNILCFNLPVGAEAGRTHFFALSLMLFASPP